MPRSARILALAGAVIVRLIRSVLWLLITVVVFVNLRLYAPSPLARDDSQSPRDLPKQLAASRAALDAGAASDMQRPFPEGYYFSYLLYGLTWVELAMRDEALAQRAIAEARWALAHLESQHGTAPFPSDLRPKYGMFYAAWKCHLLAGVVMLQQGSDANSLSRLRGGCDELAEALRVSNTPYPASYRDAAWPCDSVPGVHALVTYDRVTGEARYDAIVKGWIDMVKERLDPETGLLPHTASLPDGVEVSVARATSQTIILRLLPDIDATLASAQYCAFRQRFFSPLLGLPCVREYPSGVRGAGDVDSGPLVFRRSLSATVMMIGVAQIYGDRRWADAIAQVGEVVGLPWTWGDRKRYVGGILPLGEIIAGYAHVARPWFSTGDHRPPDEQPLSAFWRCPVHAVSALLVLPILFLLLRRKRRRGRRSEPGPRGNHEVANLESR